jgi:enamine deaminase RidA (YjgF/YER057c/UK114 family)
MTVEGEQGSDFLFGGVPYEYGAVAASGSVLFTAGACPLDVNGQVVGLGDPIAQARAAFDNFVLALNRYGARVGNVVKTTVYVLGDHEDLVAVWRVIAEGLAPFRPPSTLLGVAALGYSGQLVEIEGIAVVPDPRRM